MALLEQCLAYVQQPTSVTLPAYLAFRAAGRRSIFNFTRKGMIAMLVTIGMTLLGMVLWQATEAPDNSGQWTSDEWGTDCRNANSVGVCLSRPNFFQKIRTSRENFPCGMCVYL